MTTRLQLRTSIRTTLRNTTVWTDTTLNQWIDNAIHDFSGMFPLQIIDTITCVAAQRVYAIDTEFSYIQNVLQVEYPTGEEPPIFLRRLPENHASFAGGNYYDIRGEPPADLVIGEEPAAGETITVTYTTNHTLPSSDSSVLTVPDEGLEALRLYVTWRALTELELNETITIDVKEDLINSARMNSQQAWKLYRSKVWELRRSQHTTGYVGPWQMDKDDRIY